MKLAFFTGARSEYGILKRLISEIFKDQFFDISIIVGGMHLLKQYGYTVDEIKNDGYPISDEISFFEEGINPNYSHFTDAIEKISKHFNKNNYDAVFIIGDRFESYAAALAAHFYNIPIIHFGGGTITRGAVDNFYRYCISNFAKIHFTTSKYNYERLKAIPILEKDNIFFTGSIAIDSIKEFQNNNHLPTIDSIVPGLIKYNFVLATFHPVTNKTESISEIMEFSVKYIIESGCQVLITYPNNDPGANEIINCINKFRNTPNVFIAKNLGAKGYYTAMNNSKFIIGNSSSGIIEAPYFGKKVLNIGSRQDGRDKDISIVDVDSNIKNVKQGLDLLIFNYDNEIIKCSNIYGDGNAINRIIDILKKKFH